MTTFLLQKEMDNTSETLSKINREETVNHIPIAIYLGLIGLTGSIGNLIVCYIYGFVYTQSNSRIFLLYLAIIDFITCVINIPLEIITVMNQYEFDSPVLCKISRVMNVLTSMCSSGVLISIAIDRFRKICRPHGKQITNSIAIKLCVVLFFASASISWPPTLLYGIKTTKFQYQGIDLVGRECSTNNLYGETIYPKAYTAFIFALFVPGLVILVVMYVLIGRKVRFFAYKNEQRRSMTLSNNKSIDSKEASSKGSLWSIRRKNQVSKSNNHVDMSRDNSTDNTLDDSKEDNVYEPSNVSQETIDDAPKKPRMVHQPSSTQLDQIKRKRNLAKNTTYLMFLVTFAFIFSYLPHLILIICERIIPDFIRNMNSAQKVAYRFFLRSYFLNATVNPIIYSVFDMKFRNALKRVAKSIIVKICRCKNYDVR